MDIDDIKQKDLIDFPVWKDTGNDDETIEPLTIMSEFYENNTIVMTKFIDSSGVEFVGYVYYSSTNKIDHIFPVMFIGDSDENKIYFWKGIVRPSVDDVKIIRDKCVLPIYYETFSCNEFERLSGVIEGIYFLDRSKNYEIAVVS